MEQKAVSIVYMKSHNGEERVNVLVFVDYGWYMAKDEQPARARCAGIEDSGSKTRREGFGRQ